MQKQAIIFPGQGSQSVGMLADLAERFPEIKATFDQVSDCLHYDVWQMVQAGPAEVLNQTEHTQVAMLCADVALYRVLQQQRDLSPQIMAGHSLGEYAALVCAEALSLTDAAPLVQTRGRLMQARIPLGHGAMAAIVGLSDDQVRTICEDATTQESQVTPANYNALGQVVIAGHTDAVKRAIHLAEAQEARIAKMIPVSVPCHCSLLQPAAEKFAEVLAHTEFHVPKCAVISNVDLSIYSSAAQMRSLLAQQLYSPVRWVESIQTMQRQGIDTMIECGPAKVLAGLVKRIDKSLQIFSATDLIVERMTP